MTKERQVSEPLSQRPLVQRTHSGTGFQKDLEKIVNRRGQSQLTCFEGCLCVMYCAKHLVGVKSFVTDTSPRPLPTMRYLAE